MDNNEKHLHELILKLWEEGENKSEHIKDMFKYYNGYFKQTNFTDNWNKTPTNVCKKIVETKNMNMLDAQFTMSVMPVASSFSDYKTLKDHQCVADILNDELHAILRHNDIDSIKEKVGRWGLIGGFGCSQVVLDTNDKVEGEVKIFDLDPRNVRWNKGAKKLDELTFIGYELQLNPDLAKKRYATDAQGNFNEELCKKIDEACESTSQNDVRGKPNGIVNVQSNETAGQAYAYDTKGISAGKAVKVVVMFLVDNTVLAPQAGDTPEEQAEKQDNIIKYPNGRMIVFVPKKDHQLILEDEAAPEGFKGLGNIDIFNPMALEDLGGKGEIEDLQGIQDRINGAWLKIRFCIQNHIKTLAVDANLDAELTDTDFINHAITELEGVGRDNGRAPGMMTNALLDDVKPLLELIRELEQKANDMARVNDTMTTGERQTGTTSADQVEALQESPMSSIRGLQRNFKSYMVGMCEKIIMLIQAYYTEQRLIELSTGITIDKKKYTRAKMTQVQGQDGQPQQVIELSDEAGQAVKTIKYDKNWQFRVEIVAGTEIPRSRRETAQIMTQLMTSGMLTNPAQDLDVLEVFLRAIDLPNYRAIIKELKSKRESTPPPAIPKIAQIMQSKDMMTAFGNMLQGMAGFTGAIGQVLQEVGLNTKADTLSDAPIQSVTAKSKVGDIASIVPHKISGDRGISQYGNEIAQVMELVKNLPDDQVAMLLGLIQKQEGINVI